MQSVLEMWDRKGCADVCFFNHCFQKNKRYLPSHKALLFIYSGGVGKERVLYSGWDDYYFLSDQGEGSNHWGLESSSVTLTIQTAWSRPVSREPPLPSQAGGRPPPWMGEKLLAWSHLLRAIIPEPRSSCGYHCPSPLEEISLVLQGQGQFLMVEGDFMSSDRTGMQIQIGFCFFFKKKQL